MKTLLVFSALASIALAAPAQQNKGLEDSRIFKNSQNLVYLNTPEYLKREKKSPSDWTSNTVVHSAPTAEIDSDDDISVNTGRNTLFKPLIVKKKLGYRLYRDSEEEQANKDSHETCGRQVKVKLCDEDGKFRQMLRSSTHEISVAPSFEDDMKNSIKMAKEAVENLQRDLHESGSDKDLHKDIEIARQALEQVHENLGSMSPQEMTSKDSEDIHDVHFIIAKSEEEKMAQWKEAMNNIQKNVEIATNIEDSFRANGHAESSLHLNQFDTVKSGQKLEDDSNLEMQTDHHERNAENMKLKSQPIATQDFSTSESLKDHKSREDQHANDDMKSSASDKVEMKSVDIKNDHPLTSENQQHHEQEESDSHFTNTVMTSGEEFKTKGSTSETDMSKSTDSVSKQQSSVQNNDNGMSDIDKNALFKNSQNIQATHKSSSSDSIKTMTPKMITEQQHDNDMSKQHLKHEITENFQVKSVLDKSDTVQREVIGKETSKNLLMASDVVKISSEKNKEQNQFVSESLEESSAQKINNILKHDDNFEKSASNMNVKSIKQQVTDSNESDQQEMATPTKTISVEEDLPLTPVAQQHEDFMRAADRILQERNKDQKTSSKYKEDLANTKSAEQDADEQSKIRTKAADVVFQASQKDQKIEPDVKSTLSKAKSSESLQEADKSEKTADSNKMPMGDVDQNEKQIDDRIVSNQKVFTDTKSAEEPIRHHLTTKSSDHHLHNHHSHQQQHQTHQSHQAHQSHHAHQSHEAHKSHQAHQSHQTHHSKQDSQWLKENRRHLMKASEDKDSQTMNLRPRQNQHMPSKVGTFHDEPNRHPMNVMSGDIMKPNSHSSMRDAMEGLESEHSFRGQPSRDVPRTVYPSSSSGGAVGVFPNANTGSCAIPLLLSCSPSVVSGSLAKAHPVTPPSYSAPSYRTEDDFLGFHSKRDIQKINDNRSINILRAPAIPNQKFTAMLENKI